MIYFHVIQRHKNSAQHMTSPTLPGAMYYAKAWMQEDGCVEVFQRSHRTGHCTMIHRSVRGQEEFVLAMPDESVKLKYDDGIWRIDSRSTDAKGIAEAPCRSCKRMNDAGVKTCWCCGGAP